MQGLTQDDYMRLSKCARDSGSGLMTLKQFMRDWSWLWSLGYVELHGAGRVNNEGRAAYCVATAEGKAIMEESERAKRAGK